jgi:serine/threonine protein kinase
VRHSNVASVFHLGRTGSSYFYAMEFVEGETLERFIRRSGQVKAKVALEIMTLGCGARTEPGSSRHQTEEHHGPSEG